MSRLAMKELMETAGYRLIDPPILQPAGVFLDLVGEALRASLFVTEDSDGNSLCLRPEMTIPVCLAHINAHKGGRGSYGYMGPVFRQKPEVTGAASQSWQAGIESLGKEDREKADAEIITLALGLAKAGGLAQPHITLGDSVFLTKLMQHLGMSEAQQRMIRRALTKPETLEAVFKKLTAPQDLASAGYQGVLGALQGADPEAARHMVEDLLAIAGVEAIGGRSSREIAERFLAQAEQATIKALGGAQVNILRDFIALEMPLSRALPSLQAIAEDVGMDMHAELDAFARRIDALKERHFSFDKAVFKGGYGTRLSYYSGFAFDIGSKVAGSNLPAARGGRYDGLMERLGSDRPVPAVGAALWLDRLPKGDAA
jgi:ATP phosphoribosyltransferase regulatory subunit